jgi:hypothetical protein
MGDMRWLYALAIGITIVLLLGQLRYDGDDEGGAA